MDARANRILHTAASTVLVLAALATAPDRIRGQEPETSGAARPVTRTFFDYRGAPGVSVFAWMDSAPEVLLGSPVWRDRRQPFMLHWGTRVHGLYVEGHYYDNMGGQHWAEVNGVRIWPGMNAPFARRPDRCQEDFCLPLDARVFYVPDSLLRRATGDLTVLFVNGTRKWTVTLQPAWVRAYLARVDSTAAAFGVAAEAARRGRRPNR